MAVLDGHRRSLRLKIRYVLLRHMKMTTERADWIADAVLDEIGREPLGTLEECPMPAGCACWMCVLRLNASVIQSYVMMAVEHEAADDFD